MQSRALVAPGVAELAPEQANLLLGLVFLLIGLVLGFAIALA